VIPGLHTQVNVVGALLLRETRTRFGDQQLGYLWAIISPLLVILTFVALITFGGRSAPDGMSPVAFIATGLLPYTVFSSTLGKVQTAIQSNRALLYYPQVFPLDLAISRFILEVVTYVAVFIILMGGDAAWHGSLKIDNLAFTLSGLVLSGLLGAGLGLVISAGTLYWNTLEQVISPILRPLFFVSGIFFTANDLPTPVLHVLQYNPLMHVIEMVRDGWFPSYTSRVVDPGYLIWWALGLLLVGLTFERMSRSRIELS
jgi:capsular polysaccharide transport system permease protein